MSTGETVTTREGGNGVAANGTALLSLRGVTKTFGPVRALTRINLDVTPGQVTALAGDNGAGKSVTIKTISGLWAPDEGEILWQGKPVRMHGPKDSEALGIRTIYQDLALCDNLDIVQNMFLGHEPLSRGILDENSMEIAARKTLEELRVRTIRSIRMPVASLSGGQRQSVAVAKAVLFDAKLVIMDEPTAALGVTQTRQVLDLIKRLASQGVAVMVVSHNLNDVFEVADRIAVLYLGHMVVQDEASKFDRQSVVEYMTTGQSSREAQASATGAGAPGQTSGRKPA
ncbi:MAG: sugar ABC transporter ATP-binding protein [Solirubrobacterales bacterium]|nr:sugar ABC transporter ATP-binding protein [Solirubrobacterales bacterium]